MFTPSNIQLILASSSVARHQILANAGINFTTAKPIFDEAAAQHSLAALSPKQMAERLAELKSLSLAGAYPEAFIVGADQTLSMNNAVFHKPQTLAEAREQLQKLRGNSHTLNSSLAVSHHGEIIWQHSEHATLTMHNFDDQFLDQYLKSAGPSVLSSVGAYQIEKSGIQLFEKISGDYFTILGLPLLPLLAFLRQQLHIAA